MTVVAFTVYGRAQPAGSKVAGRSTDGHLFVRDDAKGSAEWKRTIAQVAGAHMADRPLLEGPLHLCVTFVLPRPKSHFGKRGLRPSAPRYPASRPDLTKFVRAVEDALAGTVFRDDAQIVQQILEKRYGEQACCQVIVAPLERSPSENGSPPLLLVEGREGVTTA